MIQTADASFAAQYPRLFRRSVIRLTGTPQGSVEPVRAAQYTRMSTDHQQYSIANQRDAIERFARENQLTIVRSYCDEGRSGLSLQGRAGLAELLADVVGGTAKFKVLLVYDVSRWGRFQDCDESAHYEFLCRRAGIHVEYCMEPFRNDGSPMSFVMKGLKRVMAGEYSRELSVKVFAGKARLSEMGFRAGASAGYGLRRMVVDANGTPRGIIQYGDHKFVHTDRVVLVPGPANELKILRWIFRQVAEHGRAPTGIARELNRRGIATEFGRAWTAGKLQQMLCNEKYIGNLVYNRFSTKLMTPRVPNPPERWIRRDRAFTPAIDPKLYMKTQRVMRTWTTRITNDAALAALRALFQKHGPLSADLINGTPGMPGSAFYETRFGGLFRAYALVGYTPERDVEFVKGLTFRIRRVEALRDEVQAACLARGLMVLRESRTVLRLNDAVRVAVMLGRCKPKGDEPRWLIQCHLRRPRPDWTLCACLGLDGTTVERYWLFRGVTGATVIGANYRNEREKHSSLELKDMLDVLSGRVVGPSAGQRSP